MAEQASVREWTELIRRSRLGRTTKGIAFLLATYADADGTRVFPGPARLAVTGSVDYKTAKKAVAELVAAGLLEKVRSRSGQRGRSDEYRLCFDEARVEIAGVRSPDELTEEIEAVRAKNRRASRGQRTGNGVARPLDDETADDIDDDDESPEGGTGNGVPANSEGRGTARPQDGERRSAVPNHKDLVTRTTHHEDRTLRTDVAVGGARDSPKTITSGNGFCLDCYRSNQLTLAASPDGSACEYHLTKSRGAAA